MKILYVPYWTQTSTLNYISTCALKLQTVSKVDAVKVVMIENHNQIFPYQIFSTLWQFWRQLKQKQNLVVTLRLVSLIPFGRILHIQQIHTWNILLYFYWLRWLWFGLKSQENTLVIITSQFDERIALMIQVFQPKVVIADIGDYFSQNELEAAKKISTVAVTNGPLLTAKTQKLGIPTNIISSGYFLVSQLEKQRQMFSRNKNTVVFIGSIDWRMDFELVTYCMRKLPDFHFHFYYHVIFDMPRIEFSEYEWRRNRDASKAWDELTKLPNFVGREVRTQAELSKVSVQGDIGIIPYKLDSRFNQVCHPIKFYNYCNYGLKIVSVPLGNLEQYQDKNIVFAKQRAAFVRAIMQLSEQTISPPSISKFRSWAQAQTVEKKAKDLLKVIKKYGV